MKIQINGTTDERDQLWTVYVLKDTVTNEIEFVGHCKLNDVIKTPDVRGVPGFDIKRFYALEVISVHNSASHARVEAARLIKQLNVPKLNRTSSMTRHCPIECVETGQQWRNATECVQTQGITQSALSNHLNNKPGYLTVRGLTYRRLIPTAPDLRHEPVEELVHPWVATADPATLKVEVWQGKSQSKNVIAEGNEKDVKFKAYMWIIENSTTDHAAAFAADNGVY